MCPSGHWVGEKLSSTLKTRACLSTRFCSIERSPGVRSLAAHTRPMELPEDVRTVGETVRYLLGQLTFCWRRSMHSRTAQRSCKSPAKPRAQRSVLSYGDPRPVRENDSEGPDNVNPFRTAVPFWGQTTQTPSTSPPIVPTTGMQYYKGQGARKQKDRISKVLRTITQGRCSRLRALLFLDYYLVPGIRT